MHIVKQIYIKLLISWFIWKGYKIFLSQIHLTINIPTLIKELNALVGKYIQPLRKLTVLQCQKLENYLMHRLTQFDFLTKIIKQYHYQFQFVLKVLKYMLLCRFKYHIGYWSGSRPT